MTENTTSKNWVYSIGTAVIAYLSTVIAVLVLFRWGFVEAGLGWGLEDLAVAGSDGYGNHVVLSLVASAWIAGVAIVTRRICTRLPDDRGEWAIAAVMPALLALGLAIAADPHSALESFRSDSVEFVAAFALVVSYMAIGAFSGLFADYLARNEWAPSRRSVVLVLAVVVLLVSLPSGLAAAGVVEEPEYNGTAFPDSQTNIGDPDRIENPEYEPVEGQICSADEVDGTLPVTQYNVSETRSDASDFEIAAEYTNDTRNNSVLRYSGDYTVIDVHASKVRDGYSQPLLSVSSEKLAYIQLPEPRHLFVDMINDDGEVIRYHFILCPE